ncbi:MAG: hypothetical protein AB9900_12245 [Humidesulfovibrio sp.]
MTNSESPEGKRFVIDQDRLPVLFPTHCHTAQFWEHLGRAIATFGFLEETLGKAIFAFTATRRYDSDEEAKAAYDKWLPTLERALTDQLWSLAESYGKVVHENADSTLINAPELVEDIQKATVYRNVLCHGSWRAPDAAGKSVPLFVNRKMEIFETPVDIEFLRNVQRHVAQLCCAVRNSVTHMGYRFPGSAGPGKAIWYTKGDG